MKWPDVFLWGIFKVPVTFYTLTKFYSLEVSENKMVTFWESRDNLDLLFLKRNLAEHKYLVLGAGIRFVKNFSWGDDSLS